MSSPGYVLSLDVGERRVGVAIASVIARLPAPLTTIDRTKVADVYAEVAKLVAAHEAGAVVIGLPRGLSGQETAQTSAARGFAAELAGLVDVPIVMQDEAGTSLEAERLLKARGKAYKKGDIDAEAAALILRDYLQQARNHSA